MFVFIPGSIPPLRFGPAGTDPAEISIPAVTYIQNCKRKNNYNLKSIIKMLVQSTIDKSYMYVLSMQSSSLLTRGRRDSTVLESVKRTLRDKGMF